ncbi:bacteriophage tail fiber protein [Pseudovibrio sp. FO-BEG1]|uniref:membrane protein n=1 Tax=Pseudovibrio sp. (strain FO-BEG1) TaxID=911045 RepID=UPI000238C9F5|nr:membrane protein [Pseudovibrio sp. FO-BEG1]AEV36807.1 bacteriophage tail fiber protein [Pseudovibrio sp. FO-BEG1]
MVTTTGDYLEHVSEPGERWDTIAWAYYRDPEMMDLLVKENRHLFPEEIAKIPAILPPRLTLRIPVIEQNPLDTELLPPWKRGTVKG